MEFTLENGKNYKPIAPLVRTFEVLKTAYPPIGNIHFDSAQATYDGRAHSIVIEGQLPQGVMVSYEYYLDGTLVVDADGVPMQTVIDAGRYTVKAIFAHYDENCNQIPSMSATLNVEKIKVDTSFVRLSSTTTVEYSGKPYEFKFLTWQEANGTDYDILQYGAVKYFVLDSDSGEYIEMGENELPTEVGLYLVSITLTIADGYERNYCFGNGYRTELIIESLEIQNKISS